MKFGAFWQKGVNWTIFDKASTPFWNMFLYLKQMFDAKVLIRRLPSFSVPKNYGNPTRETNFKVASKRGKPKQSYEKNARTLNSSILTWTLPNTRVLLFIEQYCIIMSPKHRNSHVQLQNYKIEDITDAQCSSWFQVQFPSKLVSFTYFFSPSTVHRNKNFVYKRHDRDLQYSPIPGRSSKPILVHEIIGPPFLYMKE